MLYIAIAMISVAQTPSAAPAADEPLTVAEKSGFRATARYDEVVTFIDKLEDRSPILRIGELGASTEGRSIPLLILADPPVSTPAQAADSKKLIAFAIGNIHAGEVCGKEALLMLAREIATTPDHPLLKELVIIFAPILNADGNERMSKDNRPGQDGPADGMGERVNAQGLDLNRDFVKLETPEVRSLVRFLNKWDPALIIDTHTTNGSFHHYAITYAGPRNPAGDRELIEYVRDKMLPAVSEALLKDTGYKSFFYGNFDQGRRRSDPLRGRWETYPALPRYGTPYRGLRNRIAILSEAYSYAPYRDRVLATRDFVRHCLKYAAEHHEEVRDLLAGARKRTIEAGNNPSDDDMVAIRYQLAPFDEPIRIEGLIEELRAGRRVATDQPCAYDVQHYGRFEPTLSVRRPYAYLLPASNGSVVETLQQHGIEVEELREDIELDVEVYDIQKISRSEKPFQKHHLVTVEAVARDQTRRIEAGTILIRTGQELGALTIHLLEPQSDDGLCTWNFFDSALQERQVYPVMRLLDPVAMTRCAVRPLPEDRELNKPVTFETMYGSQDPPNFSGSPVSGLRWLDDGEHFLQTKDKRLWKVHAVTGRCEPFCDPDKMAEALRALPTIDTKTAKKLADRTRFRTNEERSAALFEHENDLYYCRFDGTRAVRLTNTPQREELYSFSPDGSFVAFVRDYDLYVVDIATQSERALTTDGNSNIRNGKLDWVYFEELYGRRWRAYWWSPDSSDLAFLQTDNTLLPTFTVVDEIPVHQEVEVRTYPKVGDPNPTVKIGMVSAAGGSVRWVDFGGYEQGSFVVPRIGWKPDSESIYFYVQNRAQTWLDFNTAPRKGGVLSDSGRPTRLFRETTEAWVSNPGEPKFLKDGSFILSSERTGWRHLYHFGEDGALIAQMTSGQWEVRGVEHVDEEGGWIYFRGTRDSHIAHNLYRVSIDGSKLGRLTAQAGHHRGNFSPTGNYFVDTYSASAAPPQVRMYKTDGTFVRTLDTNPVYVLEEYRFGDYELLQIETADGFILEASLMKPPDFDPQKKYPVWFMTYGGPHAPTVWDTWSGGRARDRVLAEMGFVVFRCDPRSASGKGACSAWTAYEQLGVQELADIKEAIDWLKGPAPAQRVRPPAEPVGPASRAPAVQSAARTFVDGERIGMSGHSYGGFMTAYAMTHSDLFAAGIAGAPVTDWRNYDTLYTERYMNTPQENPDGYDRTSVVKAAKDLHGRLLILHGVMDNNVHMQNTLQFVQELQKAGKQFELMLYPKSRHGLGGKHYNRLVFDFIQRTLATPTQSNKDSPGAHREVHQAATD